MRNELIETVKKEVTEKLSGYLREEGITLLFAANDNEGHKELQVVLEAVRHVPLSGNKPLAEFQIMLSILGKNWNSEALIDGLYACLQAHSLTMPEMTVLLMNMHVETVVRLRPRSRHRKAVMRYIMEEVTE